MSHTLGKDVPIHQFHRCLCNTQLSCLTMTRTLLPGPKTFTYIRHIRLSYHIINICQQTEYEARRSHSITFITLDPTLKWVVRFLWHPAHSAAVPLSQWRQFICTFTRSPIVVLIIPSTWTCM